MLRPQSLTKRALAGDTDRTLKFGKSSGIWEVNSRGWDTADTLGKGKHIEFDVRFPRETSIPISPERPPVCR